MKYISKQQTVDAIQITEKTFNGSHPNSEHIPGVIYDPIERTATIQEFGAPRTARIGEWIICSETGMRVFSDTIFRALFRQAEVTISFVKTSAILVVHTPQPLETIRDAARCCYQTQTIKDASEFVTMLIDRGHESPLEHAVFTFQIICDRGISHELVRHRLASYSQESTRYCNYQNKPIAFIAPTGLEEMALIPFLERCVLEYLGLLQSGCSPQIARAVLPNCLKTEIFMTMNARELRHFLKLRTSTAAHPDMQVLATCMKDCIEKEFPALVYRFTEAS